MRATALDDRWRCFLVALDFIHFCISGRQHHRVDWQLDESSNLLDHQQLQERHQQQSPRGGNLPLRPVKLQVAAPAVVTPISYKHCWEAKAALRPIAISSDNILFSIAKCFQISDFCPPSCFQLILECLYCCNDCLQRPRVHQWQELCEADRFQWTNAEVKCLVAHFYQLYFLYVNVRHDKPNDTWKQIVSAL